MITGLGVVSPVGVDVETFWAALLSGTTGAAQVESFDTSLFPSRIGCEIRGFDSDGAHGRAAQRAGGAARQAARRPRPPSSRRPASCLATTDWLSIGTTMGESCWLEAWDPADVRAGTVPAEELVRSGPDQVGRDVAAELGLGGDV